MDNMRDTSTRRNTGGKRPTGCMNKVDYLSPNKMDKKSHIKYTNINMNKRTEAIRRNWIANAQQYDPIMRNILLQHDIQELSIQHLLNNSRRPKLNVRHKPGFKPDSKYKPPRGPAPIPALQIIEEQSALLGFAKAYVTKSYGVEDELTFLNRVTPAVFRFFSRLATSVKTRLMLHCEIENNNSDIKEVEF